MKYFIKLGVIPFLLGYLCVCFYYDEPTNLRGTSEDNSGYSME
jgi:hypothetical protein